MTPQRSTLRISALYHARGMITQDQYREFRRLFLEAQLAGQEPPELPEAWHQIPPGTVTREDSEKEADEAPKRRLSTRTVVIGVAVLALALLTIGSQTLRAARTNPVDSLRYE